MLGNLNNDSLQTARAVPAQQLLFPPAPRAVCEDLGLNWWTASKLHEDGWLSFSPQDTPLLDEAQEAELRFVGSLVVAGCDRNMLAILLRSLPKPYAYHASRLYYDWSARHWRLLPEPDGNPEAAFADWLEGLVANKDTSSLTGILELTEDALARLRNQAAAQALDRPH
jgi:hypothetical protein